MTSSIWAKTFKHIVKITNNKNGDTGFKKVDNLGCWVGLMIVPNFRCVIKRQATYPPFCLLLHRGGFRRGCKFQLRQLQLVQIILG